MGPRGSLDALEKRKSLACGGVRKPGLPRRSPRHLACGHRKPTDTTRDPLIFFAHVLLDNQFIFTFPTLTHPVWSKILLLFSGSCPGDSLQPAIPPPARHVLVFGARRSRPRKARPRGSKRHTGGRHSSGPRRWQMASAGRRVSRLAPDILDGFQK